MERAWPISNSVRIRILARKTLILAALLGCDGALAPAADADVASDSPESPLPRPPELEASVVFWKDVMTRWGERDILLHDQDSPKRVLSIARLPKPLEPRSSAARRWIADIEARTQEIFKNAAADLEAERDASLPEEWLRFLRDGAQDNDIAGEAWRLSKRIRSQQGLREVFAESYRRSGQYITRVREVLTVRGLPPEIAYLPHLESGYNPRARSRLGAMGLWQFTRGTARDFLRVDDVVDERLDP